MVRRFYSNSFLLCQVPHRVCSSRATYNPPMKLQLLGGLTPRDFLRRYWQKRPLFVRGALPAFSGPGDEMSDLRVLFALAARDDVEARIVERRGRRRDTVEGPFRNLKV